MKGGRGLKDFSFMVSGSCFANWKVKNFRFKFQDLESEFYGDKLPARGVHLLTSKTQVLQLLSAILGQ